MISVCIPFIGRKEHEYVVDCIIKTNRSKEEEIGYICDAIKERRESHEIYC